MIQYYSISMIREEFGHFIFLFCCLCLVCGESEVATLGGNNRWWWDLTFLWTEEVE